MTANVPRRSPTDHCQGSGQRAVGRGQRAEGRGQRAEGSGQQAAGSAEARATIPFSSMSRYSLLQIDGEVEEAETSENPTQSFEVHNIAWRRTHLLAVIIYII